MPNQPLGAERWLKIRSNNTDGHARLAVDEVTFLPIPEPSTVALMGLGLLALLLPSAIRRRPS
jgi:hypothetical protein